MKKYQNSIKNLIKLSEYHFNNLIADEKILDNIEDAVYEYMDDISQVYKQRKHKEKSYITFELMVNKTINHIKCFRCYQTISPKMYIINIINLNTSHKNEYYVLHDFDVYKELLEFIIQNSDCNC